MADQRFAKSVRLRKQADFQRAYRSQAYAVDDVLVMRGCQNGQKEARLGISVSRKVGNAVIRNRWKRLIREAFRLTGSAIPNGVDFVVRPRRGAEPDFHAVRTSLPRLARRIARRLERGPT